MLLRLVLSAVVAFPVLAVAVNAFPLYCSFVQTAMVWVFLFPFWLFWIGVYLLSGATARPDRRHRIIVVAECVGVVLSVLITNWPLHLTFSLARPRLEQMVAAQRAMTPERWDSYYQRANVSERAGIFRIRQIIRVSNVGFIGLGRDNGSGFTGFVYSRSGARPGNLNWDVDLGDGWRFVEED